MSKRHSLAVSPKHHALVRKHAAHHGMKISRAAEQLLSRGYYSTYPTAKFSRVFKFPKGKPATYSEPAKPARKAR